MHLPATILFLATTSLALATPLSLSLHPRQGADVLPPNTLNCAASSTRTVYCLDNGVLQCGATSTTDPIVPDAVKVDCGECKCGPFPAMDDSFNGPYVPNGADAPSGGVVPVGIMPVVPNAVGPNGEDCHVWNGRLASNPAFAAENAPRVEPCN